MTETNPQADNPYEAIGEHYVAGVVAAVCGRPCQPPDDLDGPEREEWLDGYRGGA